MKRHSPLHSQQNFNSDSNFDAAAVSGYTFDSDSDSASISNSFSLSDSTSDSFSATVLRPLSTSSSRRVRRGAHDFFDFADALIVQLAFEGRYGTSQTYSKAISSFAAFLCQFEGGDNHHGTGSRRNLRTNLSRSSRTCRRESIITGSDMNLRTDSRPNIKTNHNISDNTLCFPIEDINEELIGGYNRYLSSRGVIRNSISFYNRTLRAIYNKAVKRFRIPDARPFCESYTGVDRTRSRAVGEPLLARLSRLDLSASRSLEEARDLFLFSYATRGMTFVDMAYLKRSNIKGGSIIYTRRKTGTRMDVKIEPVAAAILRKYSRKDSEYLLPILQDAGQHLQNEEKRDSSSNSSNSKNTSNNGNHMPDNTASREKLYRYYQSRLSVYNRRLKEFSAMLGEGVSLSSYVSRHSWATAARNNNVSLTVISEGLGHSSERMTRIYLGSFNNELINSANRALMHRMRRFVSMRETNRLQI